MATMDVQSGHAGERKLDHDLPLVPFIDFMLCLVSFLLVTAVWSQMARVDADARVGAPAGTPPTPVRELHVAVHEHSYDITWKLGSTVISSERFARSATSADHGLPDLAAGIRREWAASGVHRRAGDHEADRAVIHTGNSVSYGEIIAVCDAIASARKADRTPAFATTLAVD